MLELCVSFLKLFRCKISNSIFFVGVLATFVFAKPVEFWVVESHVARAGVNAAGVSSYRNKASCEKHQGEIQKKKVQCFKFDNHVLLKKVVEVDDPIRPKFEKLNQVSCGVANSKPCKEAHADLVCDQGNQKVYGNDEVFCKKIIPGFFKKKVLVDNPAGAAALKAYEDGLKNEAKKRKAMAAEILECAEDELTEEKQKECLKKLIKHLVR